jgi:hypothetical protein
VGDRHLKFNEPRDNLALQALRDTGQVQTGQKVVVETGQRADGQFKVLRLTSDTSFAAEFAAERDLVGSQPTKADPLSRRR